MLEMLRSRPRKLAVLVLTSWALGGCANVGLVDPHTQREITDAQRESIEWQKAGVPDRAAAANARANQLQQRVDNHEIGFTEFLYSVLIDAWLGDGHDTSKKH